MVVAAHPDDETLFATTQLIACRKLWIVHVTDGAPSRRNARIRGFSTRADYARARRGELSAALAAGGIRASLHCLGGRDQFACLRFQTIVRKLAALITEAKPDVILTHPYDGGHRDHDAAAFIVQTATEFCATPPPVWEMACYYQQNGHLVSHAFPGLPGQSEITVWLSQDQREIKRKMLGCFSSQRDAVDSLDTPYESFRPAPCYDFSRAPLDGPLGYEINEFGFESALWRALATTSRQALNGSMVARWKMMLMNTAMMLMINTSRWRKLSFRVTRWLETALVTMCGGAVPVAQDQKKFF